MIPDSLGAHQEEANISFKSSLCPLYLWVRGVVAFTSGKPNVEIVSLQSISLAWLSMRYAIFEHSPVLGDNRVRMYHIHMIDGVENGAPLIVFEIYIPRDLSKMLVAHRVEHFITPILNTMKLGLQSQ
jgi:hypothetical protein